MVKYIDEIIGNLSECFMNLMEKLWKHKTLWKWYYRIIPVIVVSGWILMSILKISFDEQIW